MANQILAGAVFHAGQVIAGVDADNPPYVGPKIPYILFGGNWSGDPHIMNALTGETTAVPIPTSGTGIDGTDGVGRSQLHLADGMVIMVGYTSITVYTDLSEVGTVLDHPPGGLDNASNFGNDVHVVGDYIYVGTAFEDGHLGTIQIYNKNTLQWHSELKPTGSWYNDSGGSLVFGKSFTVTEETDLYPRSLWVGVPYDDQGGYPNSGKVYRFALGADGLPTGQQNQEIGDGYRGAEYGAFTTSDGEYVAFGYGPAGPGHVNSSPDSPYNGKINLTNTIYGPGALALTSGMTDYWTDSSLGSNYPYPPNNDFGGQSNRLIVTDDYVIVANSNHSSSTHNNANANGAAYGAVFFYDRYGANNNWTTTTPVYSFIAENNSPSIDGVGAWLIECEGKLYVGTRTDVALVFNLSDIQAVPAQISRPTAIADSIWHLSSNHSGPILLPSSMIPPPPLPPAKWVVVGVPRDNGEIGSVYVYDASDLSAQPTKLTSADGYGSDKFGYSVASTDDKIVVGVPGDDDDGVNSGSVYVYDANDLSALPTKLTAFDGSGSDTFGWSVSAFGDTIVVGAVYEGPAAAGAVYVYDANDLSAQPTKLTPFDDDTYAQFGFSVFATANQIVVSARKDADLGAESGSVYVYDANDLSALPTKLTAFDGAAYDEFGESVSANTDKVIVGMRYDDDNGDNSGTVYVYDANDLSAQPTKLTAFDGTSDDNFGITVATTSDKIIVGAWYEGDAGWPGPGSVYVYDANDLSAQPTKLSAFDGASGDKFGGSLDAFRNTIVVGAEEDDDNGDRSGSVYVYDASDLSAQPTKLTAFDAGEYDTFGESVAVG
jgi:hypothetical protein